MLGRRRPGGLVGRMEGDAGRGCLALGHRGWSRASRRIDVRRRTLRLVRVHRFGAPHRRGDGRRLAGFWGPGRCRCRCRGDLGARPGARSSVRRRLGLPAIPTEGLQVAHRPAVVDSSGELTGVVLALNGRCDAIPRRERRPPPQLAPERRERLPDSIPERQGAVDPGLIDARHGAGVVRERAESLGSTVGARHPPESGARRSPAGTRASGSTPCGGRGPSGKGASGATWRPLRRPRSAIR